MSVDIAGLHLLDEVVRARARDTPRRLALVSPETGIRYEELDRAVGAYAAALLASGVGRGDVVAVHGFSRPECLLAFFGCARIGAVFVGLNPKHTEGELAYVVGDARPRLILGLHPAEDSAQHGKLAALAAEFDFVEEVVALGALSEFLGRGQGVRPAAESAPDAPCAIVYTSGSTGAPKGALLSQFGMLRSADLTWRYWYGAHPELRTVAQHPINHVGWLVCECVSVLFGGGSLHFRERFDGGATLRLIEAERLNLWIAFPSMVMLAMASPEFASCDLSSLERLALGSLPSVEVLSRLRERTNATFSVTYGLTEANGGAVTRTDEDADIGAIAGTIGRALPGVETRVVDLEGRDVPAGTAGELLVRDDCLFLGYLNKPEATAAALDEEGWLHTGDAVVLERDGNFRLVGRLREMFKSGGYNVYPTEVEIAIGTHPAVSAVAVVEVPDPLWTEVGVAFVVLKSGSEVGPDELKTHSRAALANYKVPKRFEIVDVLPELPNGKFDKVQLRAQARSLVDASGT